MPQASALLELRPASGLERRDALNGWLAASGPIRFELDPGASGFPSGWVLISGKLSRGILDGSATLSAHSGHGEVRLEVPVSFAGTVFELVQLPRGIERLVWQPSRLAGVFNHTPLTVRPVGMFERRWLMLRRVAALSWIHPVERKRRAGLRWWRALIDLEGQYRAAGKLRSYVHNMPYGEWIARFDRRTDQDRRRIRARIDWMRQKPKFAIFANEDAGLDAQLYREFSLVHSGAPVDPAEYVCVLQSGDRLAEHALYWLAEAIIAGGDVAMAYADEDTIDAAGVRSHPRFKPDWSPEHLRSINYVGRFAAIRGRELIAAGGLRPDSLTDDGRELNLRVAGVLGKAKVVHVPAVLYHRAAANPSTLPAPRARHPLPAKPPLVSIIIPTRDAVALLRACIDSITAKSSYRHFEILVVDNQSREPEALQYLERLEHRVLRYDRGFNYSAINNFAVREARGDVVLLLNNDTEVITPDWLEEMLGHLHQDGVGAVGAKLLFPYGRVQHAGDAVGPGGCADHLHADIARDDPGYCYRAVVAQEVSAVTGACLMTWKSLYQRLGGLDEKQLPVAFNDVDYCLRVQEAGLRVIFTPHAELYHHESVSRQGLSPDREARVMRRRWKARMRHDPYYNPNLSYRSPDFSLSDMPRVKRPWPKSL
jgi:GT2 family glycosyltransferase